MIEVLYKDKDILVINKPAGISVHGDGRNTVETLADLILAEYPEMKGVGEDMKIVVSPPRPDKNQDTPPSQGEKNTIQIPRPGIVHRLDKDTSGVLILARNQKAYEFLKDQFQKREVVKTYNTLVYGHMKNDAGIIDAGIGRSPSDPRKRIASRGKTGKIRDAVTEYKVLKRITVGSVQYSWLEVKPKTGRTHQIRVHMKFLNHPVVADPLYAPKTATAPFGISRLALHASSIEFKNLAGKIVKVKAPLPEDLMPILSVK